MGGKLNPILIRVGPDGFPPAGPQPFPPAQSALKKIGLSRVDAEPNLVEDDTFDNTEPKIEVNERLKTKPSIVNLPPSPPLLRRPRPPNDVPLQMTSQPVRLQDIIFQYFQFFKFIQFIHFFQFFQLF